MQKYIFNTGLFDHCYPSSHRKKFWRAWSKADFYGDLAMEKILVLIPEALRWLETESSALLQQP